MIGFREGRLPVYVRVVALAGVVASFPACGSSASRDEEVRPRPPAVPRNRDILWPREVAPPVEAAFKDYYAAIVRGDARACDRLTPAAQTELVAELRDNPYSSVNRGQYDRRVT